MTIARSAIAACTRAIASASVTGQKLWVVPSPSCTRIAGSPAASGRSASAAPPSGSS